MRVMLTFAAALLCATTCRRFPTGGIEGTVRDRSGTPIGNVFVGVLGLAHSGRSDSSGRYRLTSVPVGTHRLRATTIGYAPLERDSVVVRQGGTTRVDFTLDRMSTGFRSQSPLSPPSGALRFRSQQGGNETCSCDLCPCIPGQVAIKPVEAMGRRTGRSVSSPTTGPSPSSGTQSRRSPAVPPAVRWPLCLDWLGSC